LEQVPISELCDKHGLQPTVFYRWQKEFFENGAAAFQPKARLNHSAEQEWVAYLEKKIQTEDEVLAELCVRPGTPLSRDDAQRLVEGYVDHYNNARLNSAVGYITPKDMLAGCQREIHAERDRKLEAARCRRQLRQQQVA